MEYKIVDVSREFLNRLFDSPDYEPRGMFICEEETDEVPHTIYTAVDNRNGEALTEEFNTRYAASMWLHGHKIRNRFGEVLNRD